ncbi:MAG: dockerin type I domain-containing protein [Candidatus Bathyarchaeota archaeon]|nr:dockerin type I domain-containing protein [Candidatus Termiticorpusculum sp.]
MNHYFPASGSADWSLADGDVVRWQYSCEGLGEDLGGSWGVTSTFADKTLLLRKYAQLTAAGSSDSNLGYALSVLQKLNPLQAEVNAAYALLNVGGQVEANKGALSNVISEANMLKNAATNIIGDGKGKYPQTAYDTFTLAVNTASAVRSNVSATQSAVDNAVVVLKDAIVVFANSKNSFTASDFNVVHDLVLAKVGQTTNPLVASVGGEWAVIALARSGQLTDTVKNAYLANLDAVLSGKPTGAVRLDSNKPTENQRVILALTSLGFDASNYKGYDFVSPLTDVSWVKSQGINSVTFALIALDSKPYVVTAGVREALVAELLNSDFSGGGFDVDYVAMALQALAPYYAADGAVRVVVDDALLWISGVQNDDDGDFGSFGTQNSESTVQVLVALSALGGDTVVGRVGVLDGLFRYALPDGGFQHVLSSGYDQMATEQAAYALVAYERYLNGENALYDMSDAFEQAVVVVYGDVNGDGVVNRLDQTVFNQYFSGTLSAGVVFVVVNADVNGDGLVNRADQTRLNQYFSGLDTSPLGLK